MATRRWSYDRFYGKIPFIEEEGGWWRPDPSFKPDLPRGAVRGDVSRQSFCAAHWEPKYFYLDEEHRCIQCERAFTFKAREQKFWYETLKYNFSSVPIRCPGCRRQRRSEHAFREQIGRAKAEVRRDPKSPAAQLALSRALVECHEKTGHGSLADAIAAARRASRLFPRAAEPLFWEGIAHSLAGRQDRARTCVARFLDGAAVTLESPSLVKRARDYLAAE